jgi:hypothetical protein
MSLALCALAILLGAPAADAQSEPVDTAAHRILSTKDFPFCTPSDAPMPPNDRAWCEVADQATTCPQIRAMCDRHEYGRGSFFDRFWGARGQVDSDNAGGALERWFKGFTLPNAQWILWAFLGVVLAIVLMLVVRAIANRGAKPVLAPDEAPFEPGLIPADVGLGPVAQLLARARREADQDVGLAFMSLYAAILKYLEERGLIRWDVSATNREYLRAIRGATPLHAPMTQVVRAVEQSKFGHVLPSRAAFDALFEQVSGLLRAAAPFLLIVVFGASCTGCELGEPDLDGHAAFTEIIRTQGIQASRLAAPIESLSRKDPAVILDAREFTFDPATLQAIERATLNGARVMLLLRGGLSLAAWPSLTVRAPEDDPVQADEAGDDADDDDGDEPTACTPDKQAAPDKPAAPEKQAKPVAPEKQDPDAMKFVGPPVPEKPHPGPPIGPDADWAASIGLDPKTEGILPGANRLVMPDMEHDWPDLLLERDGEPFALRWRTHDGELVVLADRRLLANGAMAVPANARLAVALAREIAGTGNQISYGALSASTAAESPATSFLNAGLLPFLLQLLLVLIVVFLGRGLAFGALRDRTQTGRRAFSEHVSALGQQFARIRGSRFAASLYASWIFERLRARLGRSVDTHDLAAVANLVSQRTGYPEAEVRASLEAADEMRRMPGGPSAPEIDLPLIRRLGNYLAALQAE